jgi:single-strand DNA-binding protein
MPAATSNIECAFWARIGSDPELRTSKTCKPYVRFSAAVGEGEDTQWVQVIFVGGKAAETAPTLTKGARVYCEGNIKLNTWQDQQGQQRHALQAMVWRCKLVFAIGERKPPRKPAVSQDAGEPSSPRPNERRAS